MAASRWSTSLESIARKFASRLRSLSVDHAPEPGARLTPAVGAPVPASTALTKRAPPTARAENWLLAVEGKSSAVESAHTNAPWWVALACLPAARLKLPPALLLLPPGTVDASPLAWLS